MNIAFIGAGHIARALAEGWTRPPAPAASLIFFDVVADAAASLAAASGGLAAATAAEAVGAAAIVLVAVRPPQVEPVLREIGPAAAGRPIVSVAAGVPMSRLCEALPAGASVARVMPTVAAALGLGVFLFVPGTLTDDEAERVRALFATAGAVVPLAEESFDVATAVVGCMPGLLATFIADLAAAGEAHGLTAELARRLAVDGAHGAAAMIARQGDPAAVAAVTATPGGMTEAAIRALREAGLSRIAYAAVAAATSRAKELA